MNAPLPGCAFVIGCAAVILLPVEGEGELAVDALLGRTSVGLGVWIKADQKFN